MKLKIKFSRNLKPVPFTYINNLNGYLHKVLNNNLYHDKLSLYGTSFLHGGKMSANKSFLDFPNGALWYVSSPDKEFIARFIMNLYNHHEFAFGMKLVEANVVEYNLKPNNNINPNNNSNTNNSNNNLNNNLNNNSSNTVTVDNNLNTNNFNNNLNTYLFKTKSPILIKQKNSDGYNQYYTFEDDQNLVSQLLNKLMLKKLDDGGINASVNEFSISLDTNYQKKKIRWISLKTVGNKTSVCPVIVKTNREDIAEFIYNVGVGHSTGAGFGFLL